MENELRGAVMTKFPSITSFADALKWDRKKASRVVNRVQKPSAEDMESMADLLDVHDPATFIRLFLPSVSTKWNL